MAIKEIEHLTAKQYNAKYGTKFKTNKFNAKKCEIGDQKFDSTSEGDLWWGLQQQVKSGMIQEVLRQVKEPLFGQNGTFIFNYYVDFVVIHNDGKREFLEHKGVSTDLWKAKWKMLLDKYKKEIENGTVICNVNWYKAKYNYLKSKK